MGSILLFNFWVRVGLKLNFGKRKWLLVRKESYVLVLFSEYGVLEGIKVYFFCFLWVEQASVCSIFTDMGKRLEKS